MASLRENRTNMRWITSAGGPLVLVPQTMVAQWRGVSDGGRDYAAACAVDDYLGVIQWNGVEVLVFNDEPLATTCATADLTVFLRWIYAPNEGAIVSAAQDLAHYLPQQESGVVFDCRAARYALFDAGAPGQNVVEMIEVEIAPGTYIVETHVLKPNDDVGLIAHVLRPATDS